MATGNMLQLFDMTARLITTPGEKAKFSDAEMWQFIRVGLNRTLALLRSRNVMYLRATVDVNVGAGDQKINAATLGAYGFVTKPYRLWERPYTDTTGWVPMSYGHPLPLNQPTGDYFRMWDYMRESSAQVNVIFPAPCNRVMTVRVEGPTSIHFDYSTPNQDFFLDSTIEPASHFAACAAAQARGDMDLAAALERQAMEFTDGLAQEDAHLRQLRPTRLRRMRPGFSSWRRW